MTDVSDISVSDIKPKGRSVQMSDTGGTIAALPQRRHDNNILIRYLEPLAKFAPYWMEFLGTFFLNLTVGFTNVNDGNGLTQKGFAPLAIGSSLMVAVFMGGHISGAHYNPSVTFGIWLSGRGKISTLQSIGYVLVQLVGSVIAGCVYWTITGLTFTLEPAVGFSSGHAFSSEALYTFLLVSVVLNVATTKSQADNSFYGLAIGFTVLCGAISVGPVSGGAFNPSIGFGPLVVDAINHGAYKLKYMWVYWFGPLFGSVLAAVAFRITNHHKEYQTIDIGAVVEHESSALGAALNSRSNSSPSVSGMGEPLLTKTGEK